METILKILAKDKITKEDLSEFNRLIKEVPEEQAIWYEEAMSLKLVDID